MYAWNDVEVTLKGDTKPPKLFAMHSDPDGSVRRRR